MIFVFGSNLAGRHGKGAAKYALENHGAVYGKGVGRRGNSYAIPTKDKNLKVLSLGQIESHLNIFFNYARNGAPHEDFMLTPIGTGYAGYSKKEIAKLLYDLEVPPNVYLSREWIRDYK